MGSDGYIQKLDKAIEMSQTTLHPYAVYLFGSAAENRLRSDSDFDLAYLADIHLSNYERFQLAQTLASFFNRDVDLVDLADTNTVFCAEVIAHGQVILDSVQERRLAFGKYFISVIDHDSTLQNKSHITYIKI